MSLSNNVTSRVRGASRFARPGLRVRPRQALYVEAPPPAAVRRRERAFRALLLSADLLAAVATVLVITSAVAPHVVVTSQLALPAIVAFVYTASGLYRRDEMVLNKTTLDEAPSVFEAATLSAVAVYLLDSALLATPLGATLIASTMLWLTMLTIVFRVGARAAGRRLTEAERCLVVGDAAAAELLRRRLEIGVRTKAEIVGHVELDDGTRQELVHAVAARQVHRVLIAGDHKPSDQVHEAVQLAKALGVNVTLVPRMFEVVGSSVAFDYLGGLTVLGVRRLRLSARSRFVKRAFDVLGASALLIAFAPLMAVIALAIRLTSPGPALFRQTRVGRDGGHFQVLKFRSMVADAESRKQSLLALNEADGLFKIAADPRITSLGTLLRRTALDELPQVVNVLRGEMSLVGPRPLVVDEDERIQGWHRRRLQLTPGMTGPWQVAGAARIPLAEMVTIDYLYLANWSLWGDVKILLRTLPVMVARRGQ